jgi:hypothetical protein
MEEEMSLIQLFPGLLKMLPAVNRTTITKPTPTITDSSKKRRKPKVTPLVQSLVPISTTP